MCILAQIMKDLRLSFSRSKVNADGIQSNKKVKSSKCRRKGSTIRLLTTPINHISVFRLFNLNSKISQIVRICCRWVRLLIKSHISCSPIRKHCFQDKIQVTLTDRIQNICSPIHQMISINLDNSLIKMEILVQDPKKHLLWRKWYKMEFKRIYIRTI